MRTPRITDATDFVRWDHGVDAVDAPRVGGQVDNRKDPVKSAQHFSGSVARAYAREMARFRATMAGAGAGAVDAQGAKAAKFRLNAQYWIEITAWLSTLT